jgi:hypothetical protein
LDEFLSSHAENLIENPLKRAMFQRDLWAVFDWLASQVEPFPTQRQALEKRLAQIIKRVALTKEEIASLQDNYALAVQSRNFPASFQKDQPQMAFLPADLFQVESAWVPMGRVGGPVAMTHTSSDPFLGRSVFLVFIHFPQGREATLDFIESLNRQPKPVIATGAEVALVRRMLLIDREGELILSPLAESIQIRHFNPRQSFYEFELNRVRLFDGQAGGLGQNTDLFLLFMSHGDVFENPDIPDLQAKIPNICKGCHFEDDSLLDSGNRKSIISYSRDRFPLPDNEQPMLLATTPADEARTVINWKQHHGTWQALEALWNQGSP